MKTLQDSPGYYCQLRADDAQLFHNPVKGRVADLSGQILSPSFQKYPNVRGPLTHASRFPLSLRERAV
jgi:hypothetical protein